MKQIVKLMALICIIFLALPLQAQFAGGSGTVVDPYQVATAYQLSSVRYYPSCHYIQTADIDLNIYPYNSGSGWQPLLFDGFYNGANHHISNLMINRPGGLFNNGLFDGARELKNIVLDSFSIIGGSIIGSLTAQINDGAILNCTASGTILGEGLDSGCAGGLVGIVWGSLEIDSCHVSTSLSVVHEAGGLIGRFNSDTAVSSIINCSVTGSISGNQAGGLCRNFANGQISGCETDCQVSSYNHAGGLLASANRSSISNCHAMGTVNALGLEGDAGGLIGAVYGCQISECSSTGDINGSNEFGSYSGGLLGFVSDSSYNALPVMINRCFATGDVTGWKSGGFVGEAMAASMGITISNCFSTGTALAESAAGGFAGSVSGFNEPLGVVNFSNCYCLGNASTSDPWGQGGFGGNLYGPNTFSGCYWNTDSSNNSHDFYDEDLPGIEASNSVAMRYPQSVTTFISWDFVNIWHHDVEFNHNSGYPYLEAETPGTVDAVSFNPPAGSYMQPFYLHLFCSTAYSRIYYTLDGSEPTEASTQYDMEIVIAHNTTVKSRAYRQNWEPSVICTAVYTFPNEDWDDLLPSAALSINAYPNPFAKQVNLEFSIPQSDLSSLRIYNLKGQLVKTLFPVSQHSGKQSIMWDGLTDKGKRAANGVYLCELESAGRKAACKLLLQN